jgi:pimeloyl-ACP methyl ester carboxylesterase
MMRNSTSRTDNSTIRLRDGRRLQSLEVGKSDGSPIFHFHGNGSSRLEVLTVQSVAEHLGVRLIGLDRPGIGRSDARTDYQLLDWPDDVVEVADQLGIERFAVEGLSGGGPFALACAYKIPHRLTACGLISPATGPFLKQAGSFALRTEVWMLVHLPWLVRALFRLSMRLSGSDAASIEKKLVRAGARLGAADQKLLGIPEMRKAFAQATAESFRQATDASTKDGLVFSRPWGTSPGAGLAALHCDLLSP